MLNIKSWLLGKKNIKHNKGAVYKNSVQEFLEIDYIKDGVIVTGNGRYVKLFEILPVNFYLKSHTEQQNIIYYFSSYLKIAPDNLQIRVFTQKADINAYIERMWKFYDYEENEKCQMMIEDNINLVHYLAQSEAVTRRFFLIFELEPQMKLRGNEFRDIVSKLHEESDKARKYLELCGLEAVAWENPDEELINLFYGILNKNTSKNIKLAGKALDMQSFIMLRETGGTNHEEV